MEETGGLYSPWGRKESDTTERLTLNFRDILGCHSCGCVLLASSGYRPGMLLSILLCPGQPPTTKKYLTQNLSSAQAEKPCVDNAFFSTLWF